MLLAGLNTDPREGSAALAAAILRETLAAGGRACRPLIAREGLSPTFVDPAVAFLKRGNATIRFGERLRAIRFDGARAAGLEFEAGSEILSDDDALVVAVPPGAAQDLLPGLEAPDEFRAIVNAHFRMAPPPGQPPILGVVNGLTEWLFAFPDHLSATISAADRLIDRPREELAAEIWREAAGLTGLPAGYTALADRQGEARDLRGDARAERQASLPRAPAGRISRWRATGRRPACPQPSKARFVPAIRLPRSSSGCAHPRRGPVSQQVFRHEYCSGPAAGRAFAGSA